MRQVIIILYVILYSTKIVLDLKLLLINEIQNVVVRLIELMDKLKDGEFDVKRFTEGKQNS